MKQLNHSPEAAAAVLGVSLRVAHERIAWLRERRMPTQPVTLARNPFQHAPSRTHRAKA